MGDVAPLITFKAGKCDADLESSPAKIKPLPDLGYLYIYEDDDLMHFCWRNRSASLDNPELDLVMIPTDGTFVPYRGPEKKSSANGPQCPADGRIFVLKFSSSSQRYFFWMQSKAQYETNTFSPRDLRLGEIINAKLQGDDVDVNAEIADLNDDGGDQDDDDDDEAMEDAHEEQGFLSGWSGEGRPGSDQPGQQGGRSGAGGGTDGRRSHNELSTDATSAIQNFLQSLGSNTSPQQVQPPQHAKLFTSLGELLPSTSTVPLIDALSPQAIEDLLVTHLPHQLIFLEHQVADVPEQADPEAVRAMAQALSEEQQKGILKRVLRSPQFFQGTQSLTSALREGGMPTISEALGIEVANGGRVPGGSVPLGGGDAVEAFLEGVKKAAEKDSGL